MSWIHEKEQQLCQDLLGSDPQPVFELTHDQLENISGGLLRYLPTWRAKFPEALGDVGKRMDGVAQQARIRQTRGLQEGGKVVQALKQAGVEVAVCKGVSVMSLCGWQPGERICQDLDLLIHPSQTDAAFAGVRALGWRERLARAEVRRQRMYQVDWTHPFGGRLNLQWSLIEEAPEVELVEEALARCVPLQSGWETLGQGLHPEDQLFQSVVYGRDAWKGGCLKPQVEVPLMVRAHGGEEQVRARLRRFGLERFEEAVFTDNLAARDWADRRDRFQQRFGMLGVYRSWFSEHRKRGELDLPNFGTWLVQVLGGEGLKDLPRLGLEGLRKRRRP